MSVGLTDAPVLRKNKTRRVTIRHVYAGVTPGIDDPSLCLKWGAMPVVLLSAAL
jgi:hypothetical protein